MAESPDEFKGTFTDYENFILGPVWNDMKAEFLLVEQEVIASLKIVEGNELYRYQGRAQALEAILKWPSSMMEILEADLDREKRKNG